MGSRLWALVAALTAAVVGLLLATPGIAVAHPSTSDAHVYAYETPSSISPPDHNAPARGRPANSHDHATSLAVDGQSHSSSARSEVCASYAYTRCDQLMSLAQVDTATTTSRPAEAAIGVQSEFQASGVAAKTESGLIRLSTKESWANPKTLDRHFRDHGGDFAAKSADDYAAQASQFFQRGGASQLPTKIDSNGTIRMFDPASNTFGSFGPNGMTKTFFKPTSPTYWARQPGALQ